MNNIITCVDSSTYVDDVCNAGIWAAKKLDKTLLFLHAIEKINTPVVENLSGSIGLGAQASLLEEMSSLDAQRSKIALTVGKEILEQACELATSKGCAMVDKTQRHGDITEAICDLEDDARFIVLGRSGKKHGKNFKALGSHIEQIVRQVNTPVLIANKGFQKPENFMLAYDGRETADKAVKRIIEGGLLHNLTCHLVTVNNKQSNIAEKFEQTKALLIENGFNVKASFLDGAIYDALMDYKVDNKIEMLVMGAFSSSKIAQVFLGSNTLKMMENTHLPMVILR